MHRWVRGTLACAAALGLAGVLLGVGAAAGSLRSPAPAPATVSVADPLVSLQQAVVARPDDARPLSSLGLAYVSQARTTADPTFFAKAQQAFDRSMQVQPEGNDAALTGRATLASARHLFPEALRLADASLAINPYSPTTWGVKADALTEMGRYDQAADAVQRMLDLRPGLDSYSRASYQNELRGNTAGARAQFEQADRTGGQAAAPADRAFVQHYLGELAWNAGDLPRARARYEQALALDPAYLPPLAGRARVLAASGDTAGALADYREAVTVQPQPQFLLEYGVLLQADGQEAAAQAQFDVLRATQQLFIAQGADVDIELALFEADFGDADKAVRLAARAYKTRPDAILVQDSYAWALHRAGRSAEALPIAKRALRLGTPLPYLRYHLGAIAAASGDTATARTALAGALTLNPNFDPLQAPEARRLLEGLR